MTWRIKAFLWVLCGGYLLVSGYTRLREPSLNGLWSIAYALGLLVLAGLFFYSAFDTYRKRGAVQLTKSPSPLERLTRTDKIAFKEMCVPVMLVGLAGLGLSGWLAHLQWIKVAQWPRANATLISDDISGIGDHISALGGHLIFRYDADGRQVTGAELRWGSEKKMRATLEAYRPGTTHQISYNPADLGEVNTILTYGWDLFSTPVIAAVFSLLLIFGGLVVYRWSYDLPLTSQIPSYPDDNSASRTSSP